jgi:hypothetical protein
MINFMYGMNTVFTLIKYSQYISFIKKCRDGTTEMDPSMSDAIITGSALVLLLVTG